MNFWTRRQRRFCSRPLPKARIDQLNASQAMVEGFDLVTYQAAHIVIIGTGGIGSQVATALVRKGIGRLSLLDDDRVEISNLTRQYFARHDIGGFKAVQLGRRLANDGLFASVIHAYPSRFQELVDRGHNFDHASLLICGVDNNPSRRATADFALRRKIPVVHAGVSRDGNALYVMVQEVGHACWGCVFPAYLNDQVYPCALPGIIDVLQVVTGLIVYVVDTILCGRPREWNVRHVYLDGGMPERARMLPRRPGCALCTGFNLWAA